LNTFLLALMAAEHSSDIRRSPRDQVKVKKVKVRIARYGLETHHRATEHHLPYGITQYYLPPDTGERAPP